MIKTVLIEIKLSTYRIDILLYIMQRLESSVNGMVVGLGICTDVVFVNKSDGLVNLSLV
jgi:hypothetical protein